MVYRPDVFGTYAGIRRGNFVKKIFPNPGVSFIPGDKVAPKGHELCGVRSRRVVFSSRRADDPLLVDWVWHRCTKVKGLEIR